MLSPSISSESHLDQEEQQTHASSASYEDY
jgi:hypothetical protein